MSCRTCLAVTAAGLLTAVGGASNTTISHAEPTSATTLNFAITYFLEAMSPEADEADCPTGMAEPPKPSDYKDFEPYKSMDPAELQRISENQQERSRYMRFRGPNNADMCKQPWLEPDRTMPTGRGTRLNGLDMDGGRATPGCAHGDLTAPDGRTGIDNQYARATACTAARRRTGWLWQYYLQKMRDGDFTLLMQLTGVDDLRNDDDIGILVTTSLDALTKSADGKDVVPDASFTPSYDPRYTTHFKGRIVDGVILTTERKDMKLPGPRTPARANGENSFRDAALRLQIETNGSLKGVMGAYFNIMDAYMTPTTGSEQTAGPFSCTAYYNTLVRMADAYPDPKSGKCTAISTGWEIEAIPAFIVAPGQAASR